MMSLHDQDGGRKYLTAEEHKCFLLATDTAPRRAARHARFLLCARVDGVPGCKGLISDPVSRAKSVVLTEVGLREAERLFMALFARHSPHP